MKLSMPCAPLRSFTPLPSPCPHNGNTTPNRQGSSSASRGRQSEPLQPPRCRNARCTQRALWPGKQDAQGDGAPALLNSNPSKEPDDEDTLFAVRLNLFSVLIPSGSIAQNETSCAALDDAGRDECRVSPCRQNSGKLSAPQLHVVQ